MRLNRNHHAGYTIDQTILIVAIIAILVTIIIATVGWQLIGRTGGTKLAAQFRQIEDAAGQFYAEHFQWPHQAINLAGDTAAESRQVMYALTGEHSGYNSSIDGGRLENYVSGFSVDNPGAAATARGLQHDFSSGANRLIYMWELPIPAATGLGTGNYLIVEFENVPSTEAREADEAVDGAVDSVVGRVFYRDTGTTCSGGGVPASATSSAIKNVCYAANIVQ